MTFTTTLRKYRSYYLLAIFIILTAASALIIRPTRPAHAPQPPLKKAYARLPLSFEANEGQFDAQVRYSSRGKDYSVYFTDNAIHFALKRTAMKMALSGANPAPIITGVERLNGKSNYFIGNDAGKWRTGIAHFNKIRYQEVYPGIDLIFYGNQQQLEYDFIVAPGSDPAAIAINFSGADRLSIDEDGALLLKSGAKTLRQHKPIAYQLTDDGKEIVAANYTITDSHTVAFQLAAYDASQPLIIDPVLSFSTYLGGSGSEVPESAFDVAVDGSGNIFVTGLTDAADFPLANPLQGEPAGNADIFVTKIAADGSELIYSTFIGGDMFDMGSSIALDGAGNAYLTGNTASANFPTNQARQAAFGGGDSDAFVLKLNADGSELVYSTFLGGNAADAGNGIALDGAGNAYVTGNTDSANFPTMVAAQNALGGGSDAFVTKLNATGSALVYSTFLGGSEIDFGFAIAVDAAGSAYVTGQTDSANFPTAQPLQGEYQGGTDGFVSKLNGAGNGLVYSTFLGGSDFDLSSSIAVDRSGSAYVTGITVSPDFPTANALQEMSGGADDAFVAKLNPAGNALTYSTYLGGSDSDTGSDIAVDSAGNAFITGTGRGDFPLVDPLGSGIGSEGDAIVVKINAAGSDIIYSTFLGGDGVDLGIAIAIDRMGNAIVAGQTGSANFPTMNPLQPEIVGDVDCFVTIILDDDNGPPRVQFSTSNFEVNEGDGNATVTITRTGSVAATVSIDYVTSNGTARAGLDYTATNGTLTFNGGERSKTFMVPIADDTMVESAETVNLVITNPQGGVEQGLSSAVITIIDNDVADSGEIEFAMENFDTSETAGLAIIEVRRNGAGNVMATVDYEVTDDTATANRDFGDTLGTLTFAPGVLRQTFTVRIFDDKLTEGDETISLALRRPTGGATLGLSSATITIVDDERPAQLSADEMIDFGTVKIGEMVMRPVKVENTGGERLNFSMPVISDGADLGFSIATRPGTLTLAPGESVIFNIAYRPLSINEEPVMGAVTITSNGGDAEIVVSGKGAGDFQLTAAPPMMTLMQGERRSFSIGAMATSALISPIELIAEVDEPSIELTLASDKLSPGSMVALTVAAMTETPAGDYTIVVSGQFGDAIRTQMVRLTVVDAPDFSLIFDPPMITLARGQSMKLTLNVVRRGGFTGKVKVKAPKADNLTITPNGKNIKKESTTFTVKAKDNAAAGMQELEFIGTDSTGRMRSTILQVEIK